GLGILGVIGWWWYQDLQRQAPSPAIPMKKAEAPAPATPPAPAEAQPPVLPVPVQDPVEQKTVAWVKGYYLSSKKKTVAQEVDPESRLPWDADKISEDLIQVSAGDYKFEANLKDMSLKGLNSLTSTLFTVPPQSPRQTRSRVRRRSSPQPQEEASAQSAPSTDQTEDSGFSLPGMKKMAVPE
ncbi:MAG: hypothetical protein HY400_02780, partial [Elusimicrobia bacterium]|nr:hypothetical protein [Elusimicrobiota bacterium]